MDTAKTKRDLIAQQLRASIEKKVAVSTCDRFGEDHVLFHNQLLAAQESVRELNRTRSDLELKSLVSDYKCILSRSRRLRGTLPIINHRELELAEDFQDRLEETCSEIKEALAPFKRDGGEHGNGYEFDEQPADIVERWRLEQLPSVPK
ncbi:ORF26 [callitrichine gammaherpesvirus 3]|uniref:ORF26 n=1 Tax=callitrichine gammaherpesvirus 3 TaxID=106331 RepID=Q993I4_9GAMA|nr:ORF26 [callitrichine gammaherpesvirus 3]AAK38234.1 ORF26 [callitrichine gammaherpesvirus 3]